MRLSTRLPGSMRRSLSAAFVFGTALLLAPSAHACAVCFGDPGAPMTQGTNNGIAFMLGIIVFVQGGFVAMFWSFRRRAQMLRRRRESMRVIQGGAV